MIRTLDFVRPPRLPLVDVGAGTSATGPPNPPERSIVRPPNGLSLLPPFVAVLSSVIAPIVACSRYPQGVSETVELRDQVPADRLQCRGILDAFDAEDDVLRARVRELAEAVDDPCRRLRSEVDRLKRRSLDLVGVPADRSAVLPEHLVLVMDRGRATEDVAGVGVLGHEAERLPLAAAADHDRGTWPRDRLRRVEQPRRRVVAAAERLLRAPVPGPHPVGDPERLLEQLEPVAERRERE